MKVDFERLHWENYPSTDTPINADNLNRLEEGVAGLYSDVAEIEEELGGGVGEYVTDWLDEHVTPGGSTIVVDDTLSIQGAAADAKKTGDEISDLKDGLSDIAVLKKSTNLFNKATITPATVIWDTGEIAPFANTYVSDYIQVESNTSYTWRNAQFWVAMYDASKTFIKTSTQGQATITTTTTTKYIRLVLSSGYSADLVQVNKGSALLPYEEWYEKWEINTDKTLAESNVSADAKVVGDEIASIKEELGDIAVFQKSTNLFDKTTITPNKIIWDTGEISTNSTTYISDYILAEGNTQYTWRSSQFWVAMYNDAKTFIKTSTQGASTITTTAETRFIRLVLSNGYSADNVQVNKGSVLLPYEPYYERYEVQAKPTVIVDASGGGDYTSLTQALYETRDTHADVIVRKGVYDLVEEYKAVFGDTIWTTMNDSTALDRFQYGLYIDQRSVTFEVGAKIVCDLTDTGYVTQVDTTPYNKFSAICMGANAKLYKAVVEATKTYYLCHDDSLTALTSFENVYDGCVLIGASLHQTNVIGGGTQPGGRYVVKNCYLSNGQGANSVTMRYHGANVQNSRGRVEIANCKLTGKLGIKWYGDQTCEVLWLIHNNEFGSEILRAGEVPSQYPNDNTIVYEWGNTIKSN